MLLRALLWELESVSGGRRLSNACEKGVGGPVFRQPRTRAQLPARKCTSNASSNVQRLSCILCGWP